jgi:hypothetical protein
MPLDLDLSMLETGARFQHMCFRLAQKEHPNAIAVAGSHDDGRDVICFANSRGDLIWQCKFTTRNISSLKSKIIESLDCLKRDRKIGKWILCVPVNATGQFIDWLKKTIRKYPFIKSWGIWSRETLLQKLERSPDVLHTFFYRTWKELEAQFQVEELELTRLKLDPKCNWRQADKAVLAFSQESGSGNDLVIDVIVRNRGSIQALVNGLRVGLSDVRRRLKGLREPGLLLPQITYVISLNNGKAGTRIKTLEPPLLVDPRRHQRFKIRCNRTGYAWTGYLRLAILYAEDKKLVLPTIFLSA